MAFSPLTLGLWILGLILGALLFWPLLKAIAWRLFSFDSEVAKIISQRKSSEVRVGKLVESIAPLLDNFPVDVKKPGTATVFIGQPVDFIHFDPESGVTFIEVKSGGAELSGSQKRLKQQIQRGLVRWADFRVRGEGGGSGLLRKRNVG